MGAVGVARAAAEQRQRTPKISDIGQVLCHAACESEPTDRRCPREIHVKAFRYDIAKRRHHELNTGKSIELEVGIFLIKHRGIQAQRLVEKSCLNTYFS